MLYSEKDTLWLEEMGRAMSRYGRTTAIAGQRHANPAGGRARAACPSPDTCVPERVSVLSWYKRTVRPCLPLASLWRCVA